MHVRLIRIRNCTSDVVTVLFTLEGLEPRLLLAGQDWSSAWPNVPTWGGRDWLEPPPSALWLVLQAWRGREGVAVSTGGLEEGLGTETGMEGHNKRSWKKEWVEQDYKMKNTTKGAWKEAINTAANERKELGWVVSAKQGMQIKEKRE